jgi:hydrogenase maturation protease
MLLSAKFRITVTHEIWFVRDLRTKYIAGSYMPRVLIIGYGNPMKSDDGLGWYVAQALSVQIVSLDVKVICSQQLTPENSEEASRAELVVFIDAREGGSAGEIHCEAIHLDGGGSRSFIHTHDLSPAAILQLANDLYGKAPRGFLVTVSGQEFQDGDSLSEPVSSALPNVIARVKKLISED